VLTQIRQDSSDAVGAARGVGVLVAQNPAHAGESLFAELTRSLILAQALQVTVADSSSDQPAMRTRQKLAAVTNQQTAEIRRVFEGLLRRFA
jgi:hypothetical protein